MDRAIADLERAAAEHWQAADRALLGGWLLRAAAGFTGRANSALPLGDPALPPAAAVDAVTGWYRSRALTPMVVIPGPLGGPAGEMARLDDLLASRGWTIRADAAVVMTAQAADITGQPGTGQPGTGQPGTGQPGTGQPGTGQPGTGRVELAAEPDSGWLSLYRYRGQQLPPTARELLLSAPWQAFGSVRSGGKPVAVGRVSVAAGWAGLTAIEVDPAHRRAGLGTAITAALASAAAERGARRVFLQVAEGNTAATALYATCGFGAVYRYHYRVAPAQ
ncbi:MAG: GNAT family N-acetyltransferase [Streptosporangiaceae bacterium]